MFEFSFKPFSCQAIIRCCDCGIDLAKKPPETRSGDQWIAPKPTRDTNQDCPDSGDRRVSPEI